MGHFIQYCPKCDCEYVGSTPMELCPTLSCRERLRYGGRPPKAAGKSGPRVFVVQEVLKRSSDNRLVPMHDVTPAAAYGRLVVLLGGEKPSVAPAPVVFALKQKLQDFSDGDYLLAVGDPVAIGIATAVAAKANNGRVKMLRWDREARAYIEASFTI